MRVLPFLVLASLSLPTLQTPGVADGRATRTVSSDATAATIEANSRPLPVASVSYEDLRRSYKVDSNISLASIRADAASNAGRVIELRGVVNGIMKTPAGQTVILQGEEGAAIARVSDSVSGGDALRSGATVRALLLVGAPVGNDVALTLLAASTTASGESLFHSPYDDDLTVVPPSTDLVLPHPKNIPFGRSGSAPARVPGLDPNALDAQKPAYKNLVRRFNKKLSEAQVDEIATALLNAGAASNLDPRFLAAIIAVESDFDIYCLSSSGAMGLAQLMPFNLKEAGITNAWNPTQNIMGAARLLRGHLNDYAGRPDATLLAVAAYNAGPGAVRRAGYKVPPGSQVQRYVWKVYYRYKEFAPELF